MALYSRRKRVTLSTSFLSTKIMDLFFFYICFKISFLLLQSLLSLSLLFSSSLLHLHSSSLSPYNRSAEVLRGFFYFFFLQFIWGFCFFLINIWTKLATSWASTSPSSKICKNKYQIPIKQTRDITSTGFLPTVLIFILLM